MTNGVAHHWIRRYIDSLLVVPINGRSGGGGEHGQHPNRHACKVDEAITIGREQQQQQQRPICSPPPAAGLASPACALTWRVSAKGGGVQKGKSPTVRERTSGDATEMLVSLTAHRPVVEATRAGCQGSANGEARHVDAR